MAEEQQQEKLDLIKTHDQAAHHVRIAEKLLRLIDHLSHGPASCDHKLIHSYAQNALAHVQAARRLLGDESKI